MQKVIFSQCFCILFQHIFFIRGLVLTFFPPDAINRWCGLIPEFTRAFTVHLISFRIVVLEEDEILPAMEDEFPFIYLSPHSAKLMWQKQMRQVSNLCKASSVRTATKTTRQIDEARKKQEALTRILKKELEHNRRMVSSNLIRRVLFLVE